SRRPGLYACRMRVQIRLFASLRERAGADELTLELPDGALVRDALNELHWLTGDLRAVLAVNRDYATESTPLHPGDELALIPPVSGGATLRGSIHVAISAEPLSADAISARVTDARAGAVVTFQGVTREVPALEYEAYAEMALAKVAEIAAAAASRHGLCAVAVEHRVGSVPLSEPSVVIAVSAPHRAAAFAGAREIIDALKLQAPIWKREEGEWVAGATPPPSPPGADGARS
ncbi:MAG: molybdenum cofactor biosynthesis protein MoaE, partial [Acidobacteriota bacterium]|nr:molybdenum cofactor biosynthesis protein MoaE [Acidobacteriota bacterium]